MAASPLFEDTFDGPLNPFWSGTINDTSPSAGALHQVTGSETRSGYANLSSASIDCRGKAFTIEAIPHVWNGVDNADRDFGVYGTVNGFDLEVYQDTLYYGPGAALTLLYDPVAHRWLRHEIDADGLHLRTLTSPDGVTWTLLFNGDSQGFGFESAYVHLDAGNDVGIVNDVQWANFRIELLPVREGLVSLAAREQVLARVADRQRTAVTVADARGALVSTDDARGALVSIGDHGSTA